MNVLNLKLAGNCLNYDTSVGLGPQSPNLWVALSFSGRKPSDTLSWSELDSHS